MVGKNLQQPDEIRFCLMEGTTAQPSLFIFKHLPFLDRK